VTTHDAQHRGQAQAAAGELGREKWIEDAILCGFVHAAPGVRDFNVDEVSGPNSIRDKTGLEILGVAIGQAGGDRDDAAAITDGF